MLRARAARPMRVRRVSSPALGRLGVGAARCDRPPVEAPVLPPAPVPVDRSRARGGTDDRWTRHARHGDRLGGEHAGQSARGDRAPERGRSRSGARHRPPADGSSAARSRPRLSLRLLRPRDRRHRPARRQAREDRDRRARAAHRRAELPRARDVVRLRRPSTASRSGRSITLAFDGTLFHDTGEFDAHPALRNMYLEAQITHELERVGRLADVPRRRHLPVRLLAARRQNTVGGGVFYRKQLGDHQRRRDRARGARRRQPARTMPFQFQEIEVANPVQGATTVVQLNRQRMIGSATRRVHHDARPRHSASRRRSTASSTSSARARASATTARSRSCPPTAAFCRRRGRRVRLSIAASRLSPPPESVRALREGPRGVRRARAADDVRPRPQDERANELTFGALGQLGCALGNMMLGALSRRFIDATGNSDELRRRLGVRGRCAPARAAFARDWFAGADISYQARFPQRPQPDHAARRGSGRVPDRADDRVLADGTVGATTARSCASSIAPRTSTRARSTTTSPTIRATATRGVHFLGVQAEWWFNSSTYKR